MRSLKARRPAADKAAREPHAVSRGGKSSDREATLRAFAFQSVYDGRTCIGHVCGRGKTGFEAFDADGRSPSAIDRFLARCEANALRYASGELDLHDAVDGSQNYATAFGLVAELGQDRVQQAIADAFAAMRDELSGAELVEDVASDETFAALCRQADERQRNKPLDPNIARLRRLLDDDVSIERAYAEINHRDGAAVATLQAAEFLVREGEGQSLRQWLARHSADECAAILQYLEQRKRARAQ